MGDPADFVPSRRHRAIATAHRRYRSRRAPRRSIGSQLLTVSQDSLSRYLRWALGGALHKCESLAVEALALFVSPSSPGLPPRRVKGPDGDLH